MPRKAREKSESGIYHVMLRGINQQTIFYDDEDCEKYLQSLNDCKKISETIIYAYCLMGNHIHLLVKEGKESLNIFFKRLGARFVYWYNWKYQRSGHLFQDRYKSEPIDDERYFLAVLRYIYQNPVKAGICEKPEEYRWSSYFDFSNNNFTDEQELLNYIPQQELHEYIHQATDQCFLDISDKRRLTDDEAQRLMEKFGANSAVKLASDEAVRQEKIIKKMHLAGCSIRQISRVTGKTKAVVERLLKKDE